VGGVVMMKILQVLGGYGGLSTFLFAGGLNSTAFVTYYTC
jgi:hypothetical protein